MDKDDINRARRLLGKATAANDNKDDQTDRISLHVHFHAPVTILLAASNVPTPAPRIPLECQALSSPERIAAALVSLPPPDFRDGQARRYALLQPLPPPHKN